MQPPDLVLSDIIMPIMDGLELIKKIRQEKIIAALPIILLSARAGQKSTTAGISSGADDYLVKPFSAKELLARVKQHLSMQNLRNEIKKQVILIQE
jgi:DNA-binding response OmpR family regulator